jgi:hypothetical protein
MRLRRRQLGTDFGCRWKHVALRDDGRRLRPRVLVEEPSTRLAYAHWRLLDNHGYEPSWCPGPGALQGDCPLVTCGRCPLVEHAHVVVSALEQHRGASRQVVVALRRVHPDKPLVVPESALHAPAFGPTWGPGRIPTQNDELLARIESALADPVGSHGGDRHPG